MNILNLFWCQLFEIIYLPIYNFFGYDSVVTFVLLVLFVAMQIWIFWHFFFKPFIYVCKVFVNFIHSNLLFKEIEVDEKDIKRNN